MADADTGEDVKVDAEKEADAGDGKKEPEDKDKEVVPVRKSVLNAQRRIIESQGKKLAAKEGEEDEELTPKARKLIESAVEQAVAPLHDELAFRDYFASHPEDRKYEGRARARFDAWGSVPIEEVIKTLRPAAEPEEKEEKEKAEAKAQRGSMRGSTTRPKEETVATTQAELKDVYKDIKSSDPARRAAAVRKLGIKE